MWKNKTNSIDSMYWNFSALLGIKQIKVLPMTNVTRLGNFWNFLATNFILKVAQMFGDFLGTCENHCYVSQTS